MKPVQAGTPEHRKHYAEVARRAALDLTSLLGTGEMDGELYRGLPVGDHRVKDGLREFLDTVEAQALELFDRVVAARDLPATQKVVSMRKRA